MTAGKIPQVPAPAVHPSDGAYDERCHLIIVIPMKQQIRD
jgi:hypothetical protein